MDRRTKISSLAFVAVFLAGTMWFGAIDARSAARFGALCQAEYENDWQTCLEYSWNRCGWFTEQLDETDILEFYWNLHGKKSSYSTCDECENWGADSVSLLYTNTHGGAKNLSNVILAMWDENVFARSVSDNWRLGNEHRKLSIMANYSCETLSAGDSGDAMWGRWRNTFRGGLKIALGSYDKVYDGLTTDEVGEDFAYNLQIGDSIKWAWFDGNTDWSCDQDLKVLATGSGESNCNSRKNNMRWQNFGDYARLRDEDVNWYCTSWYSEN